MTWSIARSVSRPAKARLRRLAAGRSDVRVLAVFDRACDLVTPDGGIVALVLPEIGDGPLNVVVDGAVGIFDGIERDTPVTVEGTRLEIGGLRIDLGQAAVWEPRPDWEALRNRYAAISSHLPFLRALCSENNSVAADSIPRTEERAMESATTFSFFKVNAVHGYCLQIETGSLLPLLRDSPRPANAVLSTAKTAAETLCKGWAGNVEQLREGAARLAGLGGGLTPAGDDFLTGVMLWSWLAHPDPSYFCQALADAAIPRTTTLSAAFLQAAARGECSAPWHALLAALDRGIDVEIAAAAQNVLARGATSGADSLAGFLYLQDFRSLRDFGSLISL